MSALPSPPLQLPTAKQALRINEEKWTKPLMAAGWTAFPSVILERQQALGLSAMDVNILLHLARHWWEADRLPYPSKRTIADCMKVDPRTIQRRIAQMEAGGLIKRVHRSNRYGQQSNFYDFAGLIKEATPFALEVTAAREKSREEKAERRLRKRPLRLAE